MTGARGRSLQTDSARQHRIQRGCGEDISFELELIERFGMTVHCFDPSPVGAETAERAGRKDRRLIFRPVGLAATAVPLTFETTDSQPGTMHHWYKPTTKSSAVAVAECTTIPAEMHRNGHSHIDLLKLDIEGFEYEVLESCLDAGIRPGQICVELHHFFPNLSWKQSMGILWRLRRCGYRLVHKHYYDYTLIRT